jgi:hypothetical protein
MATAEILAIGSLLNRYAEKYYQHRNRFMRLVGLHSDQPVRIWGTGAFAPKPLPNRKDVEIYAVRGQLTADKFGAKDIALGDPGLLINLFNTQQLGDTYRWGIIPHVNDWGQPIIDELHESTEHSCIINLANPDLMETISTIQSCDYIISSSLHGLVSADAFGIPNVWMRISDNVVGGDYKFLDHFSAVNRATVSPLNFRDNTNLSKNLTHHEELANDDPVDINKIDAVKDGLVKAFKKMESSL